MKFTLALASLFVASAVAMPAVFPRHPADDLPGLISEMGGLHQIASDLFTKYIKVGGSSAEDVAPSNAS